MASEITNREVKRSLREVHDALSHARDIINALRRTTDMHLDIDHPEAITDIVANIDHTLDLLDTRPGYDLFDVDALFA